MFDKIIAYSVRNKFIIGLMMVALTIWGVYSLRQLPIDAVPDITNNQVQILTISPTLATQEVEQFITTPIELALQNLQNIEEIRSISRFGLSSITVVFEEGYDIFLARQLVSEQLREAQNSIAPELGIPEIAPLSTGLGEIYQYVVHTKEGYEGKYSPMELRSIQDWIVKRQLSGIPGVAEINSMGGFLKQYEVAVDPEVLKSQKISIIDVLEALESSNENTGGAYIEKNSNAYYIRAEGLARTLEDIGNIVVSTSSSIPILIKDIATVQYGKAPRYGALVRNAEEVVGGKVMMYKGANSSEVTKLIRERVTQIQKSLPEGVIIDPYLVRDKLVSTAIGTVKKNLIEGGLIVIFILVLLLGNWRAGLIVASVIPFAMLFAVAMMNLLGISANLMSLGAIDFGLIVDGAVIIVEAIVHRLQVKRSGERLTQSQLDDEVIESSQKIRTSAAFGEIIILMVYIPILALVGIEGKMFKPMAETVMLAIVGALILSLTYVPMMVALLLKKDITNKRTIADKIIDFFHRGYEPILEKAMKYKRIFVGVTVLLFFVSIYAFTRMGGEFIPVLEEGDLAMHQILPPGSSLSQSVETAKMIQTKLLAEFPEIEDAVVNIGSAEIPTDPMPVEIGDIIFVMKPKSEWTSASSRQEMFEKIEESMQDIPGVGYEFSQPIQMRFNELMTGSRSDIAIKLYGEDLNMLYAKAKEAEKIITDIQGVGSVNVEQTIGMPQIIIRYNYDKMAQYGLHIKEVNQVVRAAFAGEKAGVIYEGEKRFDLVVRLKGENRVGINDVENLFLTLGNGEQVPLTSVATIRLEDAPMQISRDNTNRRIVIGVNVGNTDVESLVERIQEQLDTKMEVPSGYYFTYGGQFENLKAANARLSIALPLALGLIFVLLFFTFKSFSQAALIFTAIPLSAIGGIWALELRGLPFSISAGIGFIALFGVAVLNGIVLIGYFNQLKKEGMLDIKERIMEGTKVRLRPVLMTAAVASLGFLPMALSTSGGAEVQRPLATVVIGGLITATFLTLVILPLLYYWLEKWNDKKKSMVKSSLITIFILGFALAGNAQENVVTLNQAIQMAIENHPNIQAAELKIQQTASLKNKGVNLGMTKVSYAGDGMFEDNPEKVQQVGISQQFPSLGVKRASNALTEELVTQSNLNKSATTNELKRQVRNLYFEIQYQHKLKELYHNLTNTYSDYYDKAQVRVETGAATRIESLTIQSKLKEYQLLSRQTDMNIGNLEHQLQVLLHSEIPVKTTGTMTQLNYQQTDSLSNIQLQQSQQQISIEEARIKVAKSKTKPMYNVGYAGQQYNDGTRLSGVEAGVSIPLFRGQNKRQVKAQKIAVEVARSQYEGEVLRYNQTAAMALSQVQVAQEALSFYQEQIETVNPEIIRITQLNYLAGELSYIELLNTLQLVANNNQQYWKQLLEYNQAVANYMLITNQ